MKTILGLLGAAVLCAVSAVPLQAQNENASTADYQVTADVPYCAGGGKTLLMDVYVPRVRVRNPTPAILWLHGGGWERGDKNGSSGARFLAAEGFVTASIYYRLSVEAKFPADVEDCKCAVRYLRANAARYGVDPDRIGVAGASSGGHLALLVATTDASAGLEGEGGWPGVSSRVSAAASYYGPTDLRSIRTDFGARAQSAIVKLIGKTPEEDPTAFERASPIAHVARGEPPILMAHGDGDTLVPIEQSKRMLAAYRRAGLSARLVVVANANHDFAPVDSNKPLSPSVQRVHDLTVAFFKAHLSPHGQDVRRLKPGRDSSSGA
jgi:acetyl esterase/lipase